MSAMANNVRDDSAAQRYEMVVAGESAFITYRRSGDVVTLLHAEVPHALSGRGVGSALVQGALELARSRGQKVVPRCPFVADYIKKHAQFHDLLAARASLT
jgi:predicted GNAT family acetyltransferase